MDTQQSINNDIMGGILKDGVRTVNKNFQTSKCLKIMFGKSFTSNVFELSQAMWPMIAEHVKTSVLNEVQKNVNISLEYVSERVSLD